MPDILIRPAVRGDLPRLTEIYNHYVVNTPVTFVVVQKRHHTRLFPMSSREGDKSGNVMPGAHIDALCAALRALHCIDKSQHNPQGNHVATTPQ